MHYRQVTVFTTVFCLAAYCFAQAQQSTQPKTSQTGKSGVVTPSSTATVKTDAHATHTATDTAKAVKSTDSAKTVQSSALQTADTVKTQQLSDTGKTATPKKSKAVHNTVVTPAPVDTLKPAGEAPASK